MTRPKIIYVLGDETSDIYLPLIDLIQHNKDNYLLVNFFDLVSHAISQEIDRAWRADECKPRFASLLHLVEGGHRNHPAIASSLLCTGQLAQFIGLVQGCLHGASTLMYLRYFANHPAENYDLTHSCIIGNCTGSLAAAAIACSSSVLDLIPVAIHTIRIAFRIGAQAKTTADDLHYNADSLESWSLAVSGITQSQAELIVKNFNEQTV